MGYSDKLLSINNKKNMCRFLVILNLFISIILSLTGTISILYLIMFLYEIFNLSILECFILDILLPYIYSCLVNSLIKCVDNKIKEIKLEVDNLEEEYKLEQVMDDIRIRFNDLSRDKQIELLNYVKSNYLCKIKGFENIDKLNNDEILLLVNDIDEVKLIDNNRGYSRKKTIGTERI